VTKIAVAEAVGEFSGPRFEFGRVHFNGRATTPTGEVVVVGVDHASPVEGLAAVGHDDIDLIGEREGLELGIDSRERDAATVSRDEGVQLLGADKALDAAKHADDFTALGCISLRGHGFSVPALDLHSGIILISVFGMILKKPSLLTSLHVRPRALRRGGSIVAALALAGVVLSSCGTSIAVTKGVIQAVGAENQYANVIGQIGGQYVHVRAVMSNPNTDPHTFEASTSVAQEIASAQLVVQNGVGYDTFMNQLESASPNSSRHVLSVQSLAGLPSDTKNPHLWYNQKTMLSVARAIRTELSKLQPDHASYFSARLRSFTTSMASLAAVSAAFRAKFAGVNVATTEPVADYLLQTLGLINKTPFRFQADIMNGVDPSPEDITFQENLLTQHKVKVLCYNAQVSSPVTQSIRSLAQSSGVPIVAVYETMPTPGYNYQSWMRAEIAALAKALTSSTSTQKI